MRHSKYGLDNFLCESVNRLHEKAYFYIRKIAMQLTGDDTGCMSPFIVQRKSI